MARYSTRNFGIPNYLL